MNYGSILLPVTGGGAVVCAGAALATQRWVLTIAFILLGLTMLWLGRLLKGERDIGLR